MIEAARRGTLIHALLERLPAVAAEEREEAGARWLERHASDLAEDARSEMLHSAMGVIDNAEWREVFGPDALAEVPFAATVGGHVIAGTVDRLLVSEQRVRIVDFKTARRPPASLDEVPSATLRQMAAYVAALEKLWPERRVDAALLYTSTPALFVLPDDLVEAHKPALAAEQ